MKKTILFLALFLFSFAFAQEIDYGITGNLHKSGVNDVHDVTRAKFGAGAGFFANFPLAQSDIYGQEWLYLMPVAEYSMQGELGRAEESKMGTQRFHADYVAAMLYLKYFFHQGNVRRETFLFAGPRVEYLVRHKKDVSPEYEAAYYKYNLDNNMEKFGYGISLGVGMEINRNLEAFLRYDHGLSKVYTDNPNNTINRLLGLGVNYYIYRR